MRKPLLTMLLLAVFSWPSALTEAAKLPYEGIDGLIEFVHRARQAIAVERVYAIETKEEFVLAKDQAARLTSQDNPAGVAEFLFVYDGNNSPSKSDPLMILKEVSEGKRFRCVEYAIVVTGCTRSLGMSSRTLGLMQPDVETAESGAGHVVSEVWLRQFGKWVMVDGQWGAIAESKGVPLNAVELQDAIARKDPALTIRFVSQITTADRQANYIEWIIPYLYYFNFGCDQRFYRRAVQGRPAQQGLIMLVPKGANKPKAFQRHAAFQGATYTSSPKAFYPPMDKPYGESRSDANHSGPVKTGSPL